MIEKAGDPGHGYRAQAEIIAERSPDGELWLFGSRTPFKDGLDRVLDGAGTPQAVGVMHREIELTPDALQRSDREREIERAWLAESQLRPLLVHLRVELDYDTEFAETLRELGPLKRVA